MITRPSLLGYLLSLSLLFSCPIWAADSWQGYQDRGMALYQVGDYKLAEANANRALAVARDAKNGLAFQISSLNLLAFIQKAQGDLEQATQTIHEALGLARQFYGANHPQVATLLFNQGSFLEQQEAFDAALESYRGAWKIQRVTATPDTFKTLNALGNLYNQQARYQDTLAMVDALRELHPLDQFNEDLRHFFYLAAEAAAANQTYDIAIIYLREELSREQSHFSGQDVRQAETLERMASVFDAQGQPSNANVQRQQASAIRQQTGDSSLNNVMNKNELALDYQSKQQYSKAQSLFQAALEELASLERSDSVEAAIILGNLGALKEDINDKDRALALYQESLKQHEQTPTHPTQAAFVAARAGAIFYSRKHFSEAETLFLQAHTLMKQANAPKTEQEVTLENLIATYDAQGKTKEKLHYVGVLKSLRTDS